MQIVSNEFLQAMGSNPYIVRITLDRTDVIEGEAIQEIYFRGGANSSEDTILLGSAFAGSVEITLIEKAVSCAIEGREMVVELGISLAESMEWIPMGKFTAENPTAADGVLTVKAIDALGAKFDVTYEPLAGFDFSTAEGVSSTDFLTALCTRRGVEVDISGLESIPLKGAPDGFTERQIIGFISALYGGFANVDRLGVLKIRCYAEVDAQVSPDTYYEDGLEKATYSFTPGWLKCYNEAADLTMFVGDFDAQQGINLESIWMNQAILNSLWEKLEGFTYRPVPELSFLGNPLIDPGDILTLEDAAGETVKVPVMTVTHEYDGGIITGISAYGQAKTTDYQSPTRRAVIRSTESAKQYAANENAKLDQLELLKRLTKEWVDDGIYLTDDGKIGIRASAMIAGILSSADQKTFYLDLDNGILKMNATELSLAGKSMAQVARDSVSVGGTNLLRNSEPKDTISPWYGANETTVTAGKKDGRECIVTDPSTCTLYTGYCAQTLMVDGADTYTLSAQVYVEGERDVHLVIWRIVESEWRDAGGKAFTCKAGWNSLTLTVSGLAADNQIVVGIGSDKSGLLYIYHPMLEAGNTATAWSPAPADLESYADKAVSNQTQQDIFNKLTNNGALQGLFMKDGQLYVNASYLATGKIVSADGTVEIDLVNNTVTVHTVSGETKGKLVFSASGIYGYGWDGETSSYVPTLVIKPGYNGTVSSQTLINALSSAMGMQICTGRSGSTLTLGQPAAKTEVKGSEVSILGKTISFKDNGDGTFTLIGQ